MSERRITALKRSSLEGLAEGWGTECFALVTPATYEDQQEQDEILKGEPTQREQIDYQYSVIRKHFVSGKVKLLKESGEQELVDMQVDDAFSSIAIADKVYADIMGFELDPKDLRAIAAHELSQKTNDANTETSSSEIQEEPQSPSNES